MREITHNGLEIVRPAECHVEFNGISQEDAEFISLMLENEDRYFDSIETTYRQADEILEVDAVCSPALKEDPVRTITHLVYAVKSLQSNPSMDPGTDAA